MGTRTIFYTYPKPCQSSMTSVMRLLILITAFIMGSSLVNTQLAVSYGALRLGRTALNSSLFFYWEALDKHDCGPIWVSRCIHSICIMLLDYYVMLLI